MLHTFRMHTFYSLLYGIVTIVRESLSALSACSHIRTVRWTVNNTFTALELRTNRAFRSSYILLTKILHFSSLNISTSLVRSTHTHTYAHSHFRRENNKISMRHLYENLMSFFCCFVLKFLGAEKQGEMKIKLSCMSE